MMDTKIIKDVIDEMTDVANLDKDYANIFFERIVKDESLLNEFIQYVSTHKFSCENKVRGYSVVDILIFQTDHFRAYMDRGLYGMRNNECEMVLKAFETFMNMKEDPDKYVRMMTEETGTDHIEK
ncbi:MAG: hypothetical protein Q4E51_05180 [Lachnospiraceae bacterium]|nr:hypothetical protein [Lachnospiraceae bacterium]